MDLSSLSSELTAQALSFLGRVLTVATLLMSINSDPLLSENVDSSSCILCEVEKPLLFSEPRPDDLFGQAVALAKRPKPLHWKHSFSAARQSPSWWERSQFFHLDLHLGPWPDLLEFLRTLSLPFFPKGKQLCSCATPDVCNLLAICCDCQECHLRLRLLLPISPLLYLFILSLPRWHGSS